MATINLGRIKPISRGEYVPSTTYRELDFVTFGGSFFIAKQETTGNEPTDTNYWDEVLDVDGIVSTVSSNFGTSALKDHGTGPDEVPLNSDLGSAAYENTSAFDASGSAQSAQNFAIQRANHTGTQPHTTITGLGTAATANVTTSSTDTTAGRLLKVGDFGITAEVLKRNSNVPLVYTVPNSEGRILEDYGRGYKLHVDTTSTTGTSGDRYWIDTPNGGEVHIGPRAGSNLLDLIRLRSRRCILDKGTISGYDVNDTEILRKGDFGLGVGATNSSVGLFPSIVNANTALTSGLYWPSGANSSNFPFGTGYGVLLVGRRSTTQINQLHYDLENISVRQSSDNGLTWTPWRTMFHRGNILGTVSQSGGVPTGAIIQRGSNANGEFVRYADGTQICTFRGAVSDFTIASAYGDLFQGVRNFTLPAAFINNDCVVQSSVRYGNGASWSQAAPSGNTTTLVGIQAFDVVSRASGTTTNVAYMAIGRWF